MIKNKKLRITALALASLLFACSCETYEEIPELKEPVTGIKTFRPVTKQDVGVPKTMNACVAPTEYCHFYKKPIKINSIEVELGQNVNEGDVLAVADIDSVVTQIADLNGQISLLDTQNAQNEIIHECKLRELELEKEWKTYLKNKGMADEDAVKQVEKSIENENENRNYDIQMYEFMKKNYNDDISELNKIVEDGTLKAKKSGCVTYVKSLKNGHDAQGYENVVIVSDFDDLYIKGTMTTESNPYKRYDYKFIKYNGKLVEIEEYEYTETEKAFAKSQNKYPDLRYKPKEPIELRAGDMYKLVFYKEFAKDVLTIGKDSAYSDDDGPFVYVKTEDGSLEKRYYEPGIADGYYIEVKSGLTEGEKVLYEQSETAPSGKETWTVEADGLCIFKNTKGVKYAENKSETYVCEESGEVDTIYVKKYDEVKKGDPLIKIAIDSEKGDNVKIDNDIMHLKESYNSSCEDYKKKLEDIEKEISDNTTQANYLTECLDNLKTSIGSGSLSEEEMTKALTQKEEIEHQINALYGQADAFMGYGIKGLEEEKKILEANQVIAKKRYETNLSSLTNARNEQKKKNDGTGYRIITATEDGVVDSVKVSEGEALKEGVVLAVVSSTYEKLVIFPADGSIPVGFNMTIGGEDRDYEATCVKGNWSSSPNVFTEKDKVYSTQSIEEKGGNFIVRIDDEEFFKNMLDDYEASVEVSDFPDVIIIPNDYYHSEVSFEGKESTFVWVQRDGEVVKEYVVLEEGLNVHLVVHGLTEGEVLVK